MIRYISDLHLGHHNVITFDGRPFSDTDEMNDYLQDKWNMTVHKNDTIYILGDFCWYTDQIWQSLLRNLKGNKVLISGNHDLKQMSSRLKTLFADIKPYKEIEDGDRRVILSHYPIMCYRRSYDENTWMLHGHTHNTQEQQYVEKWTRELVFKRMNHSDNCGHIMNVGCMLPHMQYEPKTLDEIIDAWRNKYVKGDKDE